jgi:3-oxoadipate enol-lactonase
VRTTRNTMGRVSNTMAFVESPDRRINYALSGRENSPVLLLSNSLGTNLSMWDPQLPELEKYFSVLRYDTRGHGRTTVVPGPYSFAQLGGDVVALLDALKLEHVHFCGLSMGGMTGLWLGLHAASRVRKLIVCSASAKFGNAELWEKRIATVRQGGMKSISTQVVERWYTSEFRERAPEAVRATLEMIEGTSSEGYVDCCAALRDSDLREDVANIRAPTLIISGTHDLAATPTDGKFLASRIPGAQYSELNAAHLSNVEAPEDFTREVLRFLTSEGG